MNFLKQIRIVLLDLSARKVIVAAALFCLLAGGLLSGRISASTPSKSEAINNRDNLIPILQYVEHPALNATRQGIEDELKNSGYKLRYESAQGNPALAAQIAQKFIGESPKIMVGIPTTATQVLIANNRKQKIPIVFASVTDPIGAKLVSNLKQPGENVTGVSNYIDPARQFPMFKKILPNLSRLGVIYNPGEANSVSLINAMTKEAIKHDLVLVTVPANTTADVADATNAIINKVDAIFINNDNTALSAFDNLVKIASQHEIPVFVSDTDILDKGALAALGPNQYDIGKQAGKMIIKILQGEQPGDLSVAFPERVELHLNMKVAKNLGINIPIENLKSLNIKIELK